MRLGAVLATELMKLRRSKVTGLSLLAFALGPLGGGLFMWIVSHPGTAEQLGLLGTKADLLAIDASWGGYFTMLTQMVGLVGQLILAVIAAYVFGREYVDGTARNMLALPISRAWFVAAKFVVAALWWALLVAAIFAEGCLVALALHLPGLSGAVFARGFHDVLLAAYVSFLLVPVVAWIATLGRGYLLPLGFAMLMLLLGNVLGATGWGKWFPWSIVPLFAGVAGPRTEVLSAWSVLVVALTCGVGVTLTVAQIRWRDLPG